MWVSSGVGQAALTLLLVNADVQLERRVRKATVGRQLKSCIQADVVVELDDVSAAGAHGTSVRSQMHVLLPHMMALRTPGHVQATRTSLVELVAMQRLRTDL